MQNMTKTTARLATCTLLVTLALTMLPAAQAGLIAAVEGCGGNGSCSSTRISNDHNSYNADHSVNQGSTNQCAQSVNVGFAIAGTSSMCNDNDCVDSCTAEVPAPSKDPGVVIDGERPDYPREIDLDGITLPRLLEKEYLA